MKAPVALAVALALPLAAAPAAAQQPGKPAAAAPAAKPGAPPPPPPAPAAAKPPAPPPPPAMAAPASGPAPGAPPPPPPPAAKQPAAPPPQPPFPAPKLVQMNDALKCDWGAVKSNASGLLTIDTPAGPFTVNTGDARVVGANPGAKVAPGAIELGAQVRVYYRLKDGARALEIDVIPPPAAVAAK